MNPIDTLLDLIHVSHGWRFYSCFAVGLAILGIIHFFFGWSEATTAIGIVVVLICLIVGVVWQFWHDHSDKIEKF